MGVAQIAERLSDRFNLLSLGSRTAPPRQQTLRAPTVAWSYDLLPDSERALFRRLSVFTNGWTLEAAEAVCPGDGVGRGQVLDLLARSVDKSLVAVSEQMGQARYRMLETIREYGREKLAEAGEEADIHRRHCLFFPRAGGGRQSEPASRRPGRVAEAARCRLRQSACRSRMGAQTRCAIGPDGGHAPGRRAGALLESARGVPGGARLADRLPGQNGSGPDGAAGPTLYGLGVLEWFQMDDYQAARSPLEQSVAMWQALGDPTEIAYPRIYLGYLLCIRGESDLAFSLWDACGKHFRSVAIHGAWPGRSPS